MSMQQSYANILTAVGEDLNRPGLKDTPIRAAKAFSFLTSGYGKTLEEVTNSAVFPSDNHEMVLVKNIEFYSLCEHHLLPFYGRVHIAYLPEGKVLGLSKFARITEMFARRLQKVIFLVFPNNHIEISQNGSTMLIVNVDDVARQNVKDG